MAHHAVMRILFVEDNELVRRSLVRVLRRGGHDVAACGSPEEALAELDHGTPFELMIADFDLGHTTSDALVAEVRERLPETRVMVLTASPRALLPVGVAHIPKPITAAELLRVIQA